MDNIKLNFLHLCDAASIDNLGKINILGIFTKVFLPKVPSKLLKFTIVGNISLQNLYDSKLKIEIKIFDPNKDGVKIASPIVLNIEAPKKGEKKSGDVNIVLDLGNIEFKSFGGYNLIVYANGKELGNRSFLVEERVAEKKSMTLIYPRMISTSGDTKDFIGVLTVMGYGVLGVEKGTTTGEVDEDYLAIKTSASNVNLTEEEACDLIDEVRSKLEINKHE